ncbi:hypothetical protein A2215_01260 [Candidatus Berkelbacteria bacterium RIFOXYA2_FULL_43_10]|uniref:Schlafen AlbA-2 domain-containing protein n=1 Tax=Candidatus Berkelbacteria bacterium RIFOXYA2_FULL_43_10 TaxID=1797472 RepID=A0A1F5E6A7_9BACT|nr:MAG: hypothetical protein A2215_01260 [Candidatus Berkelbacteria bacterium RIFOXYA2_FULL_43_10]
MEKNKFQVETSESESLEFKSCQSGELPRDIWQPISAFSNSDGGTIIFGIDSDGKNVGIAPKSRDKLMRDISSYCSSKFNHRLYPEIVSEGGVIKVYIPPAPANFRPVYAVSQGLPKGGRVRIGSANVQLDDEWIRRFAIAANGGAELLDFPYQNAKYFDRKYIMRYLQAVKKRRGNVYADISVEEVLKKIRAINGNEHITLFGLLAFSNDYGLQELTAPTVDVAVTQYAGTTKVNPLDIAGVSLDDKEFCGNVVSQFENSFSHILSKLPLRSRIESSGKRIEHLAVPKDAIRETLANCIAHRDYSTYYGRVQIDIFSDRMEFSSPGRSLIPLDQLENAHPQTRNPLLMSYLRDFGITEHRGRGIRTIKNSLRNAGLPEPKFEHRHDWFVVTIYSSAFISDNEQRWLEQFKGYKLNERQLKALVYVKNNSEGINNSEYRELNNLNSVGDDVKAKHELSRLVKIGVMEPKSSKRFRRYIFSGQ